MEKLWAVVNLISGIVDLSVIGILFCVFIRPFLKNKKRIWCVGMTYILAMVFLYFVPYEMTGLFAYGVGTLVAAIVIGVIDRRNFSQKVVLILTMYLLQWIAHGVAIVPRKILFALFINTSYMMTRATLQFIIYIIVELLFCTLKALLLYLMISWIHKVYVTKQENVTRKELLLMLSMLMTVLIGYFTFSFFSDAYVNDTGKYIWNVYAVYEIVNTLYQVIAFTAILITIVIYQRIKEKQKEEKENVILIEQIENMKNHISAVEKLYDDIRGLKHDMGTHISVLENLVLKNDKKEFEKYLSELKEKWIESVTKIITGNPVTDVILTQKQKDAKEKGIDFICEFYYPTETKINAFDVSVILNNAIANAMEGTKGCKKPCVSIISYRKKNAYMIEVKNCIKQTVEIDEETGLPQTTKKDRGNHGFGLINIRKVARSYNGDIDIEQDESNFKLIIMLMVK